MGVVANVALLHEKLITDADQSFVSCKLVISSKCIQYILGKCSTAHLDLQFWTHLSHVR